MTDDGGPAPMAISVVIPHLNQPDFLARCLASLAAGQRQPDEIIVVDNGSRSLPEAICQTHPKVRLLQELTPGPGPARNLGVAQAKGTIIAFIDADCIADAGWLAAAEAAMQDDTAQILGGDVRIALADPARLTMIEAYESIYAYRMDRYIAREGFTGTGNLVVRRTVLDAVGPFAGIDVAEDRDWGQRARAKGYDIRFRKDMKVYHPARRSFSELRQKWDRHIAHDFVAAQKQTGWRLKWLTKTAAMSISPLIEVPRIFASDRVIGGRSRVLALLALTRIRAYRCATMAWLLAGGNPARLSGSWNRTA